jgi:hypothetical protein
MTDQAGLQVQAEDAVDPLFSVGSAVLGDGAAHSPPQQAPPVALGRVAAVGSLGEVKVVVVMMMMLMMMLMMIMMTVMMMMMMMVLIMMMMMVMII